MKKQTLPIDRSAQIEALRDLLEAHIDKPFDYASLADDENIFGPDTRLALDSLDALQLSMAIKKTFGIRIADSKETRKIFYSLASLADYLNIHTHT